MRRSFRVATALVVAVATGCTIVVDTDGLSGGADAGDDAARDDATSGVGGASAAPPEGGPLAEGSAPDGAEAGAPACPGSALFCDDFETGDLRKWARQHVTNDGDLLVASAFDAGVAPWRGSYALRSWAGPNAPVDGSVSGSTATTEGDVPAELTGTFVTRFYLHVPAPLANQTSLVKLGHRQATTYPEDINLKVSSSGGVDHWQINTDNSVANDRSFDSTAGVPIGRWVCVEWVITIGAAGHYVLAVDGQTVLDVDENTVGSMVAGYDSVRVGFSYSPGNLTQQVFIDDVAFATTRLDSGASSSSKVAPGSAPQKDSVAAPASRRSCIALAPTTVTPSMKSSCV